eukprot:CAMPEP_0174694220 /NCGR_PEP_ID=MMETSP1094-20130205/827_1 /TAXON_ID=156173 /ORGANISM="Chrysochromulina brevifilum, Strain UTEX LB 985" /LENGTH=669 /DNA_ID=CAMNT_0015890377 /DNA_START=63 /DNA_END=2073 /DNA_ORIENTATION=+
MAPTRPQTMRIVVWFRQGDLRLHDNPALNKIATLPGAKEVLPCFCFDPRHFGPASFGCRKTSARRAQFLIQTVANLKANLREVGSDLLVGVGKPEELLPAVVPEGPTTILSTEQVASEELTVERNVRKVFQSTDTTFRSVWGGTLYESDAIATLFGEGYASMPDVFTPFRNKVESRAETKDPLPSPKKGSLPLPENAAALTSKPGLSLDTMPDLAALGYDADAIAAALTPDPRGVMPFMGGETAGLARLKHYLWDGDHLGTYFETRNGMLGADYSSKFAPWLALGALSPRLIKQQCERYERERVKNKSTYWLVFELIWRDFFRFYAAKHGDAIFHIDGPAHISQSWVRNPEVLQRWREGRTGVPLVDANMRELAATGFMSNRGRQNVASWLALDMKLDWRAGAAHFEELLLDYDVASNWGNWASAAGATGGRINRFNIVKQSNDYDPDGAYVRHWVEELANIPGRKIHEPWKLSKDELKEYGITLGVDYPMPPKSNWAGFEPRGKGGGKGGGGYSGGGGRGGGGERGGVRNVPSTPAQAAAMRGGANARPLGVGGKGGRGGRNASSMITFRERASSRWHAPSLDTSVLPPCPSKTGVGIPHQRHNRSPQLPTASATARILLAPQPPPFAAARHHLNTLTLHARRAQIALCVWVSAPSTESPTRTVQYGT